MQRGEPLRVSRLANSPRYQCKEAEMINTIALIHLWGKPTNMQPNTLPLLRRHGSIISRG